MPSLHIGNESTASEFFVSLTGFRDVHSVAQPFAGKNPSDEEVCASLILDVGQIHASVAGYLPSTFNRFENGGEVVLPVAFEAPNVALHEETMPPESTKEAKARTRGARQEVDSVQPKEKRDPTAESTNVLSITWTAK